jgi:hypothetical protein
MHATHCAASTALSNQNPGSLASSGEYMLLDIPFIADFVALKANHHCKLTNDCSVQMLLVALAASLLGTIFMFETAK